MRSMALISLVLAFLATVSNVSASVFLPYNAKTRSATAMNMRQDSNTLPLFRRRRQSLLLSRRRRSTATTTAMAIPGYGVVEQVFVGGFSNFLSIYNIVITGRILLSWFPQAQGIAVLQPVFMITDPYLNLFRGILPSFGGLDFSPVLAFVTLNLLTSATAAVGYEIPAGFKEKGNKATLPSRFPIVNNFIGKHQAKFTNRRTTDSL